MSERYEDIIVNGQVVGRRLVVDEVPLTESPRHITRLAFRQRFTQPELIALEIACLDDPSAPIQQRQQAAALRVMQRQVAEATYIDLDRQDTRAGVLQLEAAGLIGPGRALEILDSPIRPSEVYVP